MVLHLEFAFWATWQMIEQTWHICQVTHSLAKGRSHASPGPPRNPNFLRAIYRDREQHHRHHRRPCRTREGLHRDRKPPPHAMSSRTPSVTP